MLGVAVLDAGTAWWRKRRRAAFRAGLSCSLWLGTVGLLLWRHPLAEAAPMPLVPPVTTAISCGIVHPGLTLPSKKPRPALKETGFSGINS